MAQHLYDAHTVEQLFEAAIADITDHDIAISTNEEMTDDEINAYTSGLRYASGIIKSKIVQLRHAQHTATKSS